MNIVFINHKGGVGKTTLAVNTAFCYQEFCNQGYDRKVLYIDYDSQFNGIDLVSGFDWNRNIGRWTDDEDYNRGWDNIVSIVESYHLFESEMRLWGWNRIFDCPPAFSSSNKFFELLKDNNISIDVWIVPVESRLSIEGADTMTQNIRYHFPDSRIVFVFNRCNNDEITQKDRTQVAKYPGIEVYDQVIPQSSAGSGLGLFEQKGGKPIWKFYPKYTVSLRMRDFCNWVVNGCIGHTIKNNESQVELDNYRTAFINTKSNKKRQYGEW